MREAESCYTQQVDIMKYFLGKFFKKIGEKNYGSSLFLMDEDQVNDEASKSDSEKSIERSEATSDHENDTENQTEKQKNSKSSSNSSPKRVRKQVYKEYSEEDSYSEEEEDKEYTVEYIIKHRKTKTGFEYFIKWEGYDMDECTWEPASNFNDETILKEYWKKYNEKQKEEQTKLVKQQENTKIKEHKPEKEQKSHQTPIQSKLSDDNKKVHLEEIKGIIKKEGQIYFLCTVGGKDEIISNHIMRKKYSTQLIDFYESNIKLTEVVKIESK